MSALEDDIKWLRWDLRDNDALLARCLPQASFKEENVELVFAILALGAVSRFLRHHAPSKAIELLKVALSQVLEGSRPAMFKSRKGRGRRSESPLIHQVKGVLAGLTYAKQKSGMRREAAAAWIARNISPELASRLSSKPITTRAVLEWLDRYGGEHSPSEPGGQAFKVWCRPSQKPFTAQRFKETTRGFAELIPTRR